MRLVERERGGPREPDLAAALDRARAGVEALAERTAELEATLPARLSSALREGMQAEVLPVARNLAEVRGLSGQTIRRLERLDTVIEAERRARVEDLALLVELVASGWKAAERRLDRIERTLERLEREPRPQRRARLGAAARLAGGIERWAGRRTYRAVTGLARGLPCGSRARRGAARRRRRTPPDRPQPRRPPSRARFRRAQPIAAGSTGRYDGRAGSTSVNRDPFPGSESSSSRRRGRARARGRSPGRARYPARCATRTAGRSAPAPSAGTPGPVSETLTATRPFARSRRATTRPAVGRPLERVHEQVRDDLQHPVAVGRERRRPVQVALVSGSRDAWPTRRSTGRPARAAGRGRPPPRTSVKRFASSLARSSRSPTSRARAARSRRP